MNNANVTHADMFRIDDASKNFIFKLENCASKYDTEDDAARKVGAAEVIGVRRFNRNN